MKIVISSPVGHLVINYKEKHILGLELKDTLCGSELENLDQNQRDYKFEIYLEEVFNEYFSGRGTLNKIPISWEEMSHASSFDIAVWKLIADIPHAQTMSYTELAKRLGKPRAQRAVANACGRNPIVLRIPCHRVVAKNGIGGYRHGIDTKKKILQFEFKDPDPCIDTKFMVN